MTPDRAETAPRPRTCSATWASSASWVLRQAPAAQFAGFGPAALAAWRAWNQQTSAARRQPGRVPPASAALTAALAATATTVLTGSDEQAIAQIRALLPPQAGPRAAPARRPARPALAAAIRGGPRPVPARPGPRPRPRRPDPLPHRHAPGAHPGRPARAARRPRPGDPAAALAGLGDPADARPRVRGRPVPQHHRRVPAAARPPRPRHRHGHHRTARLPQRPGHRRGAAGPGRRRPRHRAHRDQLPGRLPGHQRQPHRLPAPPRPHPRRNDHRRPVARPVLRRGRAPRRSTPAPRRPALPVPAAHRRRPARPPARPRVHLRQRLQPLPGLRRHPPHRACGTRCTATPPGSCTTWASASR